MNQESETMSDFEKRYDPNFCLAFGSMALALGAKPEEIDPLMERTIHLEVAHTPGKVVEQLTAELNALRFL